MFLPGAVALWAALAALTVSTYFYFQSNRGNEELRGLARQFYVLATLAVIIASGILLFLILNHDFRIHYVFSYSDRSLSTPYLISTLWAGQEGSFLLWLLCGMIVGLPLMRYARHYEDRTLMVYNLAQASLLMILLRQSPFRFLADLAPGQIPSDGQGLNPLLQNPWMTIHPPIMFLGYAATAVPFAFAVAALWSRRYDEWVKAAMPWALVTVVTLGCAILLGGYWAYVTLGWGGYWGWDPVENSSLVPWIASAAMVHGMLLQRARGRFRKLNFTLAILAYVLVVYATFLTRSGVLPDFSVHSFVDLGITGWLVANLTIFLLLGFGVLLWRWREIPTQAGDEPFFSRTVFFVLAISALLATALMVLLGTSAPLITRLATKPSQVSAAFYNTVTMPIGIVLACLLGTVPYLNWRGVTNSFRSRILTSGALAVACAGAGFALGAHGALYLAFLFASLFAFFSNVFKTIDEARVRRFASSGGYLAHVGLGLMLAGIITSSAYDRTEKVVLPLGQARQVLGMTLTFQGVDKPTPTSRDAMLVQVKDTNGATYIAHPRMFRNDKSNQMVANPDVHVRLTHDVYISPIEFDPGRPPASGDVVELGKGETTSVGGLNITFQTFDMSGGHQDTAALAIGATLAVSRDGKTATVTPVLTSTAQGFESQPVAVPLASGATVRIDGVDASSHRVRLAFTGLAPGGIAARATLRKGESLTYAGHTVIFDDFDLSDFDPETGKIHIGAVFKIKDATGAMVGDATAKVRQINGREQREPAALPGLPGVQIRVDAINAGDKVVEVAVLDPAAPADRGDLAKFSVDVTIKPMIGLLWAGLVVLLIGGVVAIIRRGDEFSAPLPAPTTAA